jgi:Cd2+/Zn2+-exporting ATPase
MRTKSFTVSDLTCIDCAKRVEASVCRIEGVSRCQADPATGNVTVWFDRGELATDRVAYAVRKAGHTLASAERRDGNPVLGFIRFIFAKRETTWTAIAGLLTMIGLALALVGAPFLARIPLLAAAIVIGGVPVARGAVQELRSSRHLGINALMVIAVVGAAAIGEWAEAAIVVVLFSLGEALEGFAAERARGALHSLMNLAPPTALKLLPTGETQELAVEELSIGDLVLVRPGDRVSVDGVVRSGHSSVDQAPITGESIPVEKGHGDQVFAGTVNLTGALNVKVTHLAADNTLSRMVNLVQEAQSRQAPVQRFIDRFARVYTPTVTMAAVLVAVVPPVLFGQPFLGPQGWLMRALQMLVIACPCALVISTPVSLVSAMTNAASRGVLIKGGRYLEALSQVRAFAFDKTGTITTGRPVLTDAIGICSCGQCPEDCGLQHAAALEVQSSHPLAQALLAEARARDLPIMPTQDARVLSGRGMEGTVGGRHVTVASHAHFDQYVPHPESVCRTAHDLAASGKTVTLVRHDDEICSVFGLADTPRASSRQVIADLKTQGLHTVLLTGDGAAVAQAVSRQVGLDEVRAELLPEEKVAAVAALAKNYGGVAMVGDGINDAPALARADVGIAMGGAGSAQAMETSDVILMGDDLNQLPFIVRLSRQTRQVITSNIVLALAVKAGVFALAVAGQATLWMAIVADVGASLAVILNGMRLRRMGSSATPRPG